MTSFMENMLKFSDTISRTEATPNDIAHLTQSQVIVPSTFNGILSVTDKEKSFESSPSRRSRSPSKKHQDLLAEYDRLIENCEAQMQKPFASQTTEYDSNLNLLENEEHMEAIDKMMD